MKGRGAMVELSKKLKEEDWKASVDDEESAWLIKKLEETRKEGGGKRTTVNTSNEIDRTMAKVVPAVSQTSSLSMPTWLTFHSSNLCLSRPMPKFSLAS